MDRFDWILEQLDQLSESDLVALHNEYCEEGNNMDDYIYEMYMLDELLSGSATYILNHVNFDSFNLNDDYIQFSVYGVQSSSYPENDWIYKEDIARAIDSEDFDPSNYIDLSDYGSQLVEQLHNLSHDELIRLILTVEGYNPSFDESTNQWYDDDGETIDDTEYTIYTDDLESFVDDYQDEILERMNS